MGMTISTSSSPITPVLQGVPSVLAPSCAPSDHPDTVELGSAPSQHPTLIRPDLAVTLAMAASPAVSEQIVTPTATAATPTVCGKTENTLAGLASQGAPGQTILGLDTVNHLLPVNLQLASPLRPSSKVMAALKEGLFVASSVALLAACTLAAKVLDIHGRHTREALSSTQRDEIRNTLQPGDIILTRSALHQSFGLLVHLTFGQEYSHSGTYAGDGMVLDAYGRANRRSLDRFFRDVTDAVILRPRYSAQDQVGRSTAYLEDQVGKDFDILFNTTDDEKLYCSEMTLRGLEASGADVKVPGHSLLGHSFVLPDDFRHATGIDTVKTIHSRPR